MPGAWRFVDRHAALIGQIKQYSIEATAVIREIIRYNAQRIRYIEQSLYGRRSVPSGHSLYREIRCNEVPYNESHL
jgi:hypothetical protein